MKESDIRDNNIFQRYQNLVDIDARKFFYNKNNFKPISTYCSWLKINNHKNYGVAFEEIKNEIMIKELGQNKWENKPIDFLGYLF